MSVIKASDLRIKDESVSGDVIEPGAAETFTADDTKPLEERFSELMEAFLELDATVSKYEQTLEFLFGALDKIFATYDEPSTSGRRRVVGDMRKKTQDARTYFLYGDATDPFPIGTNPEPIAEVYVAPRPFNPNQHAIDRAAEAGRREALGLPPLPPERPAEAVVIVGDAELSDGSFLISDDPGATL